MNITLPQKTGKERDATRLVRLKLKSYPFPAVTQGSKEPAPAAFHGVFPEAAFFRQPFPRPNFAVWLFETEKDRKKFLDLYPGSVANLMEEEADSRPRKHENEALQPY